MTNGAKRVIVADITVSYSRRELRVVVWRGSNHVPQAFAPALRGWKRIVHIESVLAQTPTATSPDRPPITA